MKSDIVIIGGGIAGLATGALLAKGGLRPVVLERGNQPGGRAYTYVDRGFTLNYGAHAIYRPESGPLGDVLRRLGRPMLDAPLPDALKSYWADGDRYGSIGAKPHQLLGTKFFGVKGKIAMAGAFLALRSAKPERLAGVTYGQWLDEHAREPELRRFLSALATINTYHRHPEDLSAAVLMRHFQENLFAKDYVGYMSGGWKRMYETFIAELRAGGGDLVTGATVDRLETGGDGRVVAAVTPDTRYEADAFVCTLPPQDAPSIAPAGSGLAAEMARWSGLQDVRVYALDLGFSRPVIEDTALIFDVERALYYSLHSYTTPGLAPPGGQLLHAMAYLSPEERADQRLLDGRKAELLAGLDRFFPGWRDAVVVRRELSGVRVASARQTLEQQGERRVPLHSSAAPNLMYAGDGRGLPYMIGNISLASAIEAADAVPAVIAAARATARDAVPA